MGPQNLQKIFDNKEIIEHSETLFLNTGYFTNQLHKSQFSNKTEKSILADSKKDRSVEDVLQDLNSENGNNKEEKINSLLLELYDCMEKENLVNSKVPSKVKIQILKCLYKFVESRNEQILLNIAKIILSVSQKTLNSQLIKNSNILIKLFSA